MVFPKEELKKEVVQETIDKEQLATEDVQADDSTIQPLDDITTALMPELEELVKKNPNRLIGCGG